MRLGGGILCISCNILFVCGFCYGLARCFRCHSVCGWHCGLHLLLLWHGSINHRRALSIRIRCRRLAVMRSFS